MQIGSAASYPLATPASTPASLSAAAANTAIPPVTAVAQSPSTTDTTSSPDTTVSLSADGTRLAVASDKQQGANEQTKTTSASSDEKSPQQEQQERQTIAELASRDADVRAHEAAHAAVGGAYAGSPSYTLQQGPDGKAYAIGGEVGIDLSAVSGDPAATISKMEVVMRAALAPIDPSAQDLRVAAEAQGLATAARTELAEQKRTQAAEQAEAKREKDKQNASDSGNVQTADASASLQVYQSIASPLDSTPLIVAVA